MQYLAFVVRDETGAYRATLPDFPGCEANATSWLQMEGAIRHAVRVHAARTGAELPPPTPIEELDEDSGPPNSCWMLVNLFAYETQPHQQDIPAPAPPPKVSLMSVARMKRARA